MPQPDGRPTFNELLAAASEAAQDEYEPFTPEDMPGPGDHAWLDQFLTEHNRAVPPSSDAEFLGSMGVTDSDE